MKPQKNQAPPQREMCVAPAPGASCSKSPEIAPEEWDFRRIREDQLDAAIYHEYARSCDWVVKAFQRWHKKRLRWAGAPSGRTLGEICREIYQEPLSHERTEVLLSSMPKELFKNDVIYDVWLGDPLFPQPFLTLPNRQIGEAVPERRGKCPAFWEEKAVKPRLNYAWWHNHPYADVEKAARNLRRFTIVIDLGSSKSIIKEEIDRWVDTLQTTNIEKYPLPKGTAARPPWHRLKELALYRLNKLSRMNRKDFLEFVGRQTKENTADPNAVLPCYSPAGFSEALKNAEEYLKCLFPNPTDTPRTQPH